MARVIKITKTYAISKWLSSILLSGEKRVRVVDFLFYVIMDWQKTPNPPQMYTQLIRHTNYAFLS